MTRRALVVGAGISGLANAYVLAGLGWEVDVVEHARAPRSEGFTLDLFGPGYDAADRLGLLGAISARGRRYTAADYIGPDGRTHGRMSIETLSRSLGGRYFSITRGGLEAALRGALPPQVRLRFGRTVAELDVGDAERDAAATLDDGTRLQADLVLGCDGLHSRTRDRAISGGTIRHLGFLVAAFSVRDPQVAGELGLAATLSDTVSRQVGVYAADEEIVSVFVAAPGGPEIPHDPVGWVRERMLGSCPVADRLAERVADDLYIDQVAQSIVPTWRSGRLLLMGDAAHAVSLLAGQGASLAIAGAQALGEALAASDDPLAAAARYERVWRPRVEAVQERGRRLVGSFLPRSQAQRLIRRLMLEVMRVPPVARLAARAAAGPVTH